MITFFGIPKAFRGHNAMIQYNAIRSWALLREALSPRGQIVLCGDEHGLAEVAESVGALHLPEITKSAYGTPLLSDAFRRVVEAADHELLCYLNADIILTPAFLEVATRLYGLVGEAEFLAVCRRWTIDVQEELAFEAGWEHQLASMADIPDSPNGIDLFLFPCRSPQASPPPFVVGRPGWDRWMIYEALRRSVPVIDLSECLQLLHQRHDYAHVPRAKGNQWEGPEAKLNRRLVGSRFREYSIADATHKLLSTGELVPSRNPREGSVVFCLRRWFARYPRRTRLIQAVCVPLLYAEKVAHSPRVVAYIEASRVRRRLRRWLIDPLLGASKL